MTADFKAGMMRASDLCNERAIACKAESDRVTNLIEKRGFALVHMALIEISRDILTEIKASS